jgi:hypothetical protein
LGGKTKIKNIFIFFGIFLIVLVVATKVKAGLSDNVSNFIWGGTEQSNDGIINGNETQAFYVSLNSTNCDTNGNGRIDPLDTPSPGCPVNGTLIPAYGVNFNSSSGKLTGYAWMGSFSNTNTNGFGYIDFNPQDHCGSAYTAASCLTPSGGLAGVSVDAAGAVTGWARIVEIARATVVGNSGGWDGWVHMNGTAKDGSTYKTSINFATNEFTNNSYAWSELGYLRFCNNAQGYCGKIAGAGLTYSLKICNQCLAGYAKISPITLNQGNSLNVKACYVSGLDCAGTDVTSDAGTVWSSSDETKAYVSGGTINGVAVGNANIGVTYNTLSDSLNVTVNASCTCDPAVASTKCTIEQFADSCGNATGCTGTKSCGWWGNWIEVAP